MKRAEIRIYLDFNEEQIDLEEIRHTLEYDFDNICNCKVKRVDIIDEKEN